MGIHHRSATEQLSQALFEEASDGIFISDTQGRFLEVNCQGCELLGYSREELAQLAWQEVLPAEDTARRLLGLEKDGEGQTTRVEGQVRSKDGRLLSVEIRARQLGDGRLLTFVRNIGECKQAEKVMYRYELFADHSRDIILVVGRTDGRILEANATAMKTYGYSREELLALSIHDLRSPETQGLTAPQIAKADTHGILFETVHQRQDGSTFPVEVSSQGATIGGRRILISVVRDISERKQTEKALRESEEQYRLLFTEMLGGFALHEIITDEAGRPVDYRFITVNAAFEEMTGLQAKNIVGKTAREVIPGLETAWIERYGQVALTGASIQFEDYVSDMKKYFEVRAYCPKPGQFAVIFQDISEHKRAEAALKESEERFRLFMDNSPTTAWIKDDQGRCVYLSRTHENHFGGRLEDWVGKTTFEVWPPEVAEQLWQNDQAVLAADRLMEFTEEIPNPDGSQGYWWSFKFPFRDASGRRYIGGIGLDMTERQQVEEALYLTRFSMERAADSIYWLDAEGGIVDINETACRTLGYSREELLQLSVFDLDPELSRQVWRDIWQRLKHVQARRTETTHRTKDGRIIPVEVVANLIEFGGRTLDCAFVRDIRERKQAEEARAKLEAQLRQAQKMESIGLLAGGVAHDFNNLLTVIGGYSALLLSKISRDDPMFEPLEQIRHAGDRAAALTRQLLAFSRKQMLAPTLLNLNDLITNLNKMLGRLIGEDIRLALVLQPGLWSVTTDPGQIEQVILNLVINARDAMPTGGLLTLETGNVQLDGTFAATYPEAPLGPCVMLAITDTGHGMDGQTKARIFEPFFTTKEIGQGTGLGLATVYGIIKQSGGDILVYSELGQGTTFRIYLPAHTSASSDLAAPPAEPVSRGGGETILLVEDDEAVRQLVRRALQDKGYTILEAHQGHEALALARQHQEPIGLLLTDVVMPQMSGRELAEKLRVLQPELKVLFMSGYTDDAVVRHGLLTAEVEFLPKPFSPRNLASKVREILDK